MKLLAALAVLAVAQVVLVVLRANDVLAWSWTWVLAPLWASPVGCVVAACLVEGLGLDRPTRTGGDR